MSALAYICGYGYGSNSDDSDCEYVPRERKRQKLPTPDLSKVPVIVKDEHVDDPTLHGGRSRSFPHERGNWATFVYIRYPEEYLQELVEKLQSVILPLDDSCQKCEDLHVSLSKTLVLTYHLITPFTTSIQDLLVNVKSFSLGFDSIKIYCNEEKSRTFIALKADHSSNNYLQEVTKNIDKLLLEYKLPTFYEDPSFHMSILWLDGDKQEELTSILSELNEIVSQEVEKALISTPVHRVHCKTGNKHYQFSLS